MPTITEQQELIEDIKRPIRYYRIQLHGYGGEIVYGHSTPSEYNYWVKQAEDRKVEFNLKSDDDPFLNYMINKDDSEEATFSTVPSGLQREDEWWAQGDIDCLVGVSIDSAHIDIEEIETDDIASDTLLSLTEGENLYDFVDHNDVTIIVDESPAMNESNLFYAMSVEKGTFFYGLLKVEGKIDFSKLKINTTEFPNGDEIIHTISYDDEEIDNNGNDTNSKALYIELIG